MPTARPTTSRRSGRAPASLVERARTGRGQLVSTSLLREGLYTLSFDLAFGVRLGVPIRKADRKAMPNPAINSYQDGEGAWFWIVGLEGARHWPPLCRAVGHPEWIDSEHYGTPAARAANAEQLIAEIDAIFATKTRAEWGAIFDAEEDLWWAPVQTSEEILADAQVMAAGGFAEIPDGPTTTLLPATPVDFGGSPIEHRHMAPEHGQHTDEILAERGHSAAEIAKLRADGAVA